MSQKQPHHKIMTSIDISATLVSATSSQINTSPSASAASSLSSSCERDILNGSTLCSSVTNSQLPSVSDGSTEAVVSKGLSSPKTSLSTRMSNVLHNQASTNVLPTLTSDISSSWSTIKNATTPLSTSSLASSPSSSSLSLAGTTSSTAAGGGAPLSSAQLLLNGIVAGCVNNLSNQHQMLTEDPHTLQLALELSMVGLNDASVLRTTSTSIPTAAAQTNAIQLHNYPHIHQQQPQHHYNRQQQQQLQQHSTSLTTQQQQQQQQFDINTLNSISAVVAAAESVNNVHHNNVTTRNAINNITNSSVHSLNQQFPVSSASGMLPTLEDRSKKSQNMTECVPVPSSEHVAEIVGRQGCKIKALRAKTNTYIKTPVRGEEPVFVVTGRKEDVAKAKREILSAAEHFSLIRATRKPSFDGCILNGNNVSGGSGKTPPGPPCIPGQMTIQVRVPYRVVGLVVGPKGATIKHIQQETHTYIVTPSREKEPIFEVTGLPDNVQSARKQIEAHIALRTGNSPAGGCGPTGGPGNSSDVSSVHTINTLSQILNDADPDLLASLYKNGICSAFDYIENNGIAATGAVASVSPNSASMSLNLATSVGINATSNQMLMGSLTSYNNFQIQSINSTPSNIDYINNRVNNCNVSAAVVDTAGSVINSSCSLSHLHQHVHTAAAAHRHVGNITAAAAAYNNINSTVNAINMNGNGMNTAGSANTMQISSNGIARSYSSASSTTSSKSANNSGGSSINSSRPELMNIWKNLGDSLDVDEGIGESPSIWTLPTPLTILSGSHCSPSTSISPTDSLLGEINIATNNGGDMNVLINQQQRESTTIINATSAGINGKNMLMQQLNIGGTQVNHNIMTPSRGMRRECLVCGDKEVTAVLVPCGHNMFCMECANRICSSGDATCPVCSLTVYHAMRILA